MVDDNNNNNKLSDMVRWSVLMREQNRIFLRIAIIKNMYTPTETAAKCIFYMVAPKQE